MNETEVRELANKVLQADRTIHIQQLGLPWAPPEGDQLQLQQTVQEEGQKQQDSSQVVEQQEGEIQEEDKAFQVFKLLVQECQYLLDDRTKDSCAGKPESVQLNIQIDGIKKVLEIETVDDQELLVQKFFGDSDELTIEPENVIDKLDEFQEDREERKKDIETWAQALKQRRKLGQEMTEKERKERERAEEKLFWDKMSNVLPKSHEILWNALDQQLQKYYKLL